MAQFPSNAAKDDEDERAAAEAAAAEAQDAAPVEDAPDEPQLTHSSEKVSDGPDDVAKIAADAPDDTAPAKPSAPSVNDYIAKKYGLDSSAAAYDKLAGDNSKVLDARQNANDTKSTSRMFEGLSYAFGGGKRQDDGFFQHQRDDADKKVALAQGDHQQLLKNYLTAKQLGTEDVNQAQKEKLADFTNAENDRKLQQQKLYDDKNSEISKTYRAMVARAVPGMASDPSFANMTATELANNPNTEKYVAAYEKMLGLQDSRAWRQQQALENNRRFSERQDDKETDRVQKVTDGYRKALDEQTASSRTPLGVTANKVLGAQRIFKFADVTQPEIEEAQKDPEKAAALAAKLDHLTPQQNAEVTTALMNQVSPGNPSLGAYEHLKANTADETKANLIQYFTAHPEDAGMGEFLKRNLSSINNEYKLGQQTLNAHKDLVKAGNPAVKRYPEQTSAIENQWLQNLAAGGGGAAPAPAAPAAASYTAPQEAGIKKVMNDNKITREQAIQELRKAGMLK